MKLQTLPSVLALVLPLQSFAFFSSFEIHGGGGISSLPDQKNGVITFNNHEKNTLTNTTNWNTGIEQLGVGFGLFGLPYHSAFLNSGRLELNAYDVSNRLNGQVFNFTPNYASYNYTMSLHSIRLMVDVVSNLFTFGQTSLFAKAGVGSAINSADNDILVTQGCCNGNSNSFSHHSTTKFAAEGGVGVQYNFNNQIGIGLEYLYAHLGNVQAGEGFNAYLSNISPINFDLYSQSALLTLHYVIA